MTSSLTSTETKLLQTARGDDRDFALQVARSDPHAVIAFRAEFANTLDEGFGALVAALAETDPPGCRSRMEALVPHVAVAVGTGFLKRLEESESVDDELPDSALSSHVPDLKMADLFHASACLAHDDAACRRLVRIVDEEIGPSLIRRFRQRIPAGRCEQIVQDVLSQAWSAPRAARSQGGSAAAAEPRRLERFHGMSTLKSWLYSIGFRMLQSETRSPRDRERTVDGDSTALVPVSRELTPDELAALGELTTRFKPRLAAALSDALRTLQQRTNPRLGHVAWLWLPGRIPQVVIADMLGVTKARISQQVKEIVDEFMTVTAGVRQELSAASGIDLDRLTDALRETLPAFFPPVLEQEWLEELRRLQSARPQLLQLAYLRWREQLPLPEIADQIGESPARVAVLVRQLDDWRRSAETRVARQLSSEAGVPADLLQKAVQLSFNTGFCGELSL